MKALIIGGSGFIGSHIVDKFLKENWEVTIFDKQREMFRQDNENIIFESGNINDKNLIENIVARNFDAIIYSLSTTTPKTSNENPEFDIASNLIPLVNLLEICTRHKTGKIVYLSSGGAIYGESNTDKHTENDSVFPICSYAITKLSAEKYLHMYEKLHGLSYTALRISNPYGPRQNPMAKQGVISVFLHKILNEQKIEIWGDGSVIRDYIYVADVANACFHAANSTKNGVFNIGSGIGLSLKKLVEILALETNKTPELHWLPGRDMDVPKVILDCTNAEKNLNWKPLISLNFGLKKTINWINSISIENK
ncbi:NAD-dependent epimerase/dehydratase family protein [Janthinobacterium sp.]|uniref:NAD-dependent epimerase/dehydratase family protein n=1 Tax=Janthinobacterium sp. TaxID=1871054 RepID=UPI00260E69C3|nr:NAD-dependent epimerase/dehydratase family protein [Janthinobacterium sp.]